VIVWRAWRLVAAYALADVGGAEDVVWGLHFGLLWGRSLIASNLFFKSVAQKRSFMSQCQNPARLPQKLGCGWLKTWVKTMAWLNSILRGF
jgi:hypothetical protein